MKLRAVVFDVDGTLAETERDGHRVAFNRAFRRLGLPDRWDEALYGRLLWVAGGRERLRFYFDTFRPELRADDGFVRRLHRLKNLEFRRLVARGRIGPRPGVCRLVRELIASGIAVGVATTGSREWVEPLLASLLGRDLSRRLGAVVTGEDVRRKKPDPEAYLLALARLGVEASAAVAVEDSQNGLAAAKAAGLPCLVVAGFYSEGHDFSRADLVTDGFGEPGRPARVLFNPHGLPVGGLVTAELLSELCRRATLPGRCSR